MMCRSTSEISLLVSMQFYPNYLITMTAHIASSRVVIAPSASVLAPMIRGEPDMEGLLLGSRELLCLSSRISRTLVSCSSLSELYLLGESVSCQMQGNKWAGGLQVE